MSQEIYTPTSDGVNTTVVVKFQTRIQSITIARDGFIVFNRERAQIDNATGSDITQASRLPETQRRVGAVLQDSVTVGPLTVSFSQLLQVLGKFEAKFRAEDVAAAEAARLAALNP